MSESKGFTVVGACNWTPAERRMVRSAINARVHDLGMALASQLREHMALRFAVPTDTAADALEVIGATTTREAVEMLVFALGRQMSEATEVAAAAKPAAH